MSRGDVVRPENESTSLRPARPTRTSPPGPVRPPHSQAIAADTAAGRPRSGGRTSSCSAFRPARAGCRGWSPAGRRAWRRGWWRRAGPWRRGAPACDHVAERALLHDLAGIHHRDTVADLDRNTNVMGDEDDGHAEFALQLAQQQQDLDLHGGIERGGRLVREQIFGRQASARAIIARWRMPPDISCG